MFKKTLITLAIASIIPLQAFAVSEPIAQASTHNTQNYATHVIIMPFSNKGKKRQPVINKKTLKANKSGSTGGGDGADGNMQ